MDLVAGSQAQAGRQPAGRRLGPATGEVALLALLALWVVVPLVAMLAHAGSAGVHLTGADGVIPADQLQYLAWIRDAAGHWLAANLFAIPASAHTFIQPMFTLSGGLVRLGISVQIAYLLWKPAAVVALFAGAAVWVRRLIPASSGERIAALAIALFFYTPVASLVLWTGIGTTTLRSTLTQLSGEMFAAGQEWGYLPTAIAVGLIPVVLLATERMLRCPRPMRARGACALAVVAALLCSWLHPWQGITLVLTLAGLAGWERGRRWTAFALPMAAAVGPLLYYQLLSRYDSAWRLAAHAELAPHLPLPGTFGALLPMAVIAAAGIRRPGADRMERALLLWCAASVVSYLALRAFPAHAWEGLSLPFAVLAVRAWRRLRAPRAAGVLAVAALTVPGAIYVARALRDATRALGQEYYLTSSERRALTWVATKAPPGAVIADPLMALVIPSQTDRAVWVGHQFWSRDFGARSRAVAALFAGRLSVAASRETVSASGARLVVSGCADRTNLVRRLAPLLESAHRFGCAAVYVVHRDGARWGP